MDRRIQKVIAFLNEHLQDEFSLKDVADFVNLSPSRLRHLFEEETGQPPSRYLRALRLQKASELLESTFISVKEVMKRVGVKSQSQFVRDFKKQYGLSPTEFRAQTAESKTAVSDDANEDHCRAVKSDSVSDSVVDKRARDKDSRPGEDVALLQEIMHAVSSAHPIDAALESALRKICTAHDDLERQVKERTLVLSRANQTLKREIEQQRQTVRLLKEKEQRLKLAFSAAKIFTWEWDVRSDTTEDSYLSGDDFSITGTGEPQTRQAFLDIVDEQDREAVNAAIERCLNENADYDVEFGFVLPDGTTRWATSKGRLYRDEAGEPERLVGVTMDVTARRQAEDAVRAQRAFLRTVIDTSPNLIFVKDWQGRFVLANKSLAEKYSATVEEVVGRTDIDFSPRPAEVEKFLADDREVMQSGQPKLILEEPITFASTGETRWFQTIKVPLITSEGQRQLLGMATDITEHRRAQRELEQKAEFEKTIARISARFINPVDFDEAVSESLADIGALSGAGRAYLHQFKEGGNLPDKTGKRRAYGTSSAMDNLQGASVEIHPWWMAQMRKGQTIYINDVSQLPPEASAERKLLEMQGIKSLIALPVYAGAELAGFIAFENIEMTGAWDEKNARVLKIAAGIFGSAILRRRTEAALKRREHYLAALVEAQQKLLVCKEPLECYEQILGPLGRATAASRTYVFENHTDAQHRIVSTQRAEWCEAGVTSEMNNPVMLNLVWDEFYAPWGEALARGEVVTDIEPNYPEQVHAELMSRQGILSFLLLPLSVGGKFYGFIGFDNCTERRRWEPVEIDLLRGAALALELALERIGTSQMLHEREQQLLQAQKMEAVGRLAGGVAHDFNNMLAAIIMQCEMLLHHLDVDADLRRPLEDIQHAAERSAALTQQLLAFSRKQILQPKTFDLNDAIRDTEIMLRRLLGEHIKLRIELANEPCLIKADPTQVQQIIMNLAVNSRDAISGSDGQISISTRRVLLDESYAEEHPSMQPGRYAVLTISDTGEGIDEETQRHIFEPFFTTKETGKGTGLGLSTVYGIVKQSGGNITVTSEVGRGTSFEVQFPNTTEAKTPVPALRGGDEDLPRGTETALVVEDEEMIRELAHELLELGGYTVLKAADGHEAMNICEQYSQPIHLLVSDVIMPGMSGSELAAILLEKHPEMRVLFMSGYTDEAIGEHGVLNEGMNFIQKPFSVESFLTKVREVLDNPLP